MKIKNLTAEYISGLDKDALHQVGFELGYALTASRKTLKMWQTRPILTDRDAKEYAGIRRAHAHQEAMQEAVMCREDELVGPGVLSSYDHSEKFC